jgi:hypothetical protein
MEVNKEYYKWLRLDPIPLKSSSKKPMGSWLTTDPSQQWKGVGKRQHNIGLRLTSDKLTVVDADSLNAATAVSAKLKGWGLIPDHTVNTGGKHRGVQYWLNCEEKPVGVSYRNLKDGDGELRIQNCYVVAPPSVVEVEYTFNVDPLEVLRQRKLTWQDLCQMLPPIAATETPEVNPTWSKPAIPILTFKLKDNRLVGYTKALASAAKGQPLGKYPTRSEAMAMIVRILLRLGWTWPAIRHHFYTHAPKYLYGCQGLIRYTCGKFSAQMTPTKLIEAHEHAAGLIKSRDRDCYRALLSEAARWNGRHEYDPANGFFVAETTARDLGRLMDCSKDTAHRACKRLEAAGIVRPDTVGQWKKQRSVYLVEV